MLLEFQNKFRVNLLLTLKNSPRIKVGKASAENFPASNDLTPED